MQSHSGGVAQHAHSLPASMEGEYPISAEAGVNSSLSGTDLRTNVERQFVLMNDVHNRIREEFLKAERLFGH